MANSYFVFSDTILKIDRFHLCSWEFGNETALIEFGCEILTDTIRALNTITLQLYVPWLNTKLTPTDLYDRLKKSSNSKFIFNDSVKSTESFDGGDNNKGVVHTFSERDKLAILPITFETIQKGDKLLTINVNLKHFKAKAKDVSKIYIRFYLEPNVKQVSTRKAGVGRTKIIYDIKLNELRNLPNDLENERLCPIECFFCFNIIPNDYDLVSYEAETLKNVRNLEYEAFKAYLPNAPIKDEKLMVVFNKRSTKDKFKVFITFSKERIGTGQFALAVLINLVCGLLLSFPTFKSKTTDLGVIVIPFAPQFWLVIIVIIIATIYFLGSYLISKAFQMLDKAFDYCKSTFK